MKTTKFFLTLSMILLFGFQSSAQMKKKSTKRHDSYRNNKIYINLNPDFEYWGFKPNFSIRNLGYERRTPWKGISLTGEFYSFNLNKNDQLRDYTKVERYPFISSFVEAVAFAATSVFNGGQLLSPNSQVTIEHNQKGNKITFGPKFYLIDLILPKRYYNPDGWAADITFTAQYSYLRYKSDLEFIDLSTFREGFKRYKKTIVKVDQQQSIKRSNFTFLVGTIFRYKERISFECELGTNTNPRIKNYYSGYTHTNDGVITKAFDHFTELNFKFGYLF